ncbi:MAG: hypothetical protein ACRD3O_01650, partial [Terriglobia bacterium]
MAPAISGPGGDADCPEQIHLPDFATGLTPPTAATYWRTLKPLGALQLISLARRRAFRRRALRGQRPIPVRLRQLSRPAAFPEWRRAAALRMIAGEGFSFLNLNRPSSGRILWSPKEFSRLWLYHLNYFDFVDVDLSSPKDRSHLARALDLMVDWCEQNVTGAEVGWEPYP